MGGSRNRGTPRALSMGGRWQPAELSAAPWRPWWARSNWGRPYFYCVPCGQGFAPLDAALEVAAGRKQFDLQQAAAKLTAEVPYETARELFRELTGVELSTARMHELTNAVAEGVGVLAVAPGREEIAAKIAPVAEGRRWRPIVV